MTSPGLDDDLNEDETRNELSQTKDQARYPPGRGITERGPVALTTATTHTGPTVGRGPPLDLSRAEPVPPGPGPAIARAITKKQTISTIRQDESPVPCVPGYHSALYPAAHDGRELGEFPVEGQATQQRGLLCDETTEKAQQQGQNEAPQPHRDDEFAERESGRGGTLGHREHHGAHAA